MKRNLLVLACALVLGACATAEKPRENSTQTGTQPIAEAQAQDRVDCSSNSDQRSLEIERKPLGCSLVYTKLGRREKVVASDIGPQECMNALSQIRGNLVAAGFRCQ